MAEIGRETTAGTMAGGTETMDIERIIEKINGMQSERQGRDVYLDIETYRGEDADLDKEIAWILRKDKKAISEMEMAAIFAQDEIEAYHAQCEKEGKKPLKKDTAEWQKAIDKYETALLKIAEKEVEQREKAALLNSARILCVSIVTEKSRMVFGYMPLSTEDCDMLHDMQIAPVMASDEAEMLKSVSQYLDELEPIAHAYTWNGYGFDLPHLRLRMGRNKVKKPECLRRDSEINYWKDDLMVAFGREYMGEKYCKLPKACDLLGLDTSKIGDGSEVAKLYENGQWVELLAYNVLDSVVLQQIKSIICE